MVVSTISFNPLDLVTLICTVELNPAVDVPVTVNTVWTGPDRFMHHNIAQPDMRSNGIYMISTVKIYSFNRNQSGNYNCTVTITSNNSFLMTSDSSSNTTRVRVGERRFGNIMYMSIIITVIDH